MPPLGSDSGYPGWAKVSLLTLALTSIWLAWCGITRTRCLSYLSHQDIEPTILKINISLEILAHCSSLVGIVIFMPSSVWEKLFSTFVEFKHKGKVLRQVLNGLKFCLYDTNTITGGYNNEVGVKFTPPPAPALFGWKTNIQCACLSLI